MIHHSNPRLSILSTIFLLLPWLALGFQEGNSSGQDTVSVQKPEPISMNRLVAEMEELRGLIDLNKKKIAPTARLERIDSLYIESKDLIASEETKATDFIASNPNRQKIDNLIRRWEAYRMQLTGWETEIMAYVERNLRLLESIEKETEIWNSTFERVAEQDVPREVLNNVRSVILDLGRIQKQTKDNNYRFLRLQNRISRLGQSVDEVVKTLIDKKGSETYDLLHQRHPPLWNVSFGPDAAGQQSEVRHETIEGSVRLTELYQTHKDKFYLLIVFGIGLSLFIVYLRKGLVKSIGIEAATQPSSDSYLLFKMPAVVVIFLLFFIARLQLLAGTRFMGDILISSLLICAVVLIIHRISKRFRGLIIFSIVFIILDSIKTYVWFDSAHYRLYLMGEALLMAGVVFYFTRPYLKTRQETNIPLGRFMIRLVPLVYFLCAVSVISNLLGYTNLSDLATKISTQSGIAAIIAYGLLLVFKSIFISWLDQRFHREAEPDLVRLEILKKHVNQFLNAAVVILFATGFLNIIDEMRNFTDFFSSLMNEPYIVGNLTFTLGSIFMFLVILFLSYFVSRLIAFLISEQHGMLRYFRLPKGIPSAISLVLRYSILVFGIILALSYLNVDLSQFNLMAGALGLGIGFGLQTVISNFVSGLILVFERPILPGDTIEVNNLFGKVHKIGVRSLSLIHI